MDGLARLLAALLALIASLVAVRAPHHDDSALVVTRVGTWDAIRGAQPELDQGHVVIYEGEPCSHLHLAGHHTTHGAPFARLTELGVGDVVSVYASVGCTYRITRAVAWYSPLEPPYGDLLMQTSLPGGFWLMWGTKE